MSIENVEQNLQKKKKNIEENVLGVQDNLQKQIMSLAGGSLSTVEVTGDVKLSNSVYPPQLNCNKNNPNIQLNKLDISGVETPLTDVKDYMNIETYTSVKLDCVHNRPELPEGTVYYNGKGYSERLITPGAPENVLGDESTVSGLPWNVYNSNPSVSTCTGFSFWILSLLGYIPDGYGTQYKAKYFLNNDGKLPPLLFEDGEGQLIALGVGRGTIGALKPVVGDKFFTTLLLEWMGGEELSNLVGAPEEEFLRPRCETVLAMNSTFKIEKGVNFGLFEMDSNHFIDMLRNSSDIQQMGTKLSDVYLHWTKYNEIYGRMLTSTMDLYKKDFSVTDVPQGIAVLFGLSATFTAIGWHFIDEWDFKRNISGHSVHGLIVYLLHTYAPLILCNQNELTNTNIEFMKKLTAPNINLDTLEIVNVDVPLDFTPHVKPSETLKNVPIFVKLYTKIAQITTLLDGINLGKSSNRLADTLVCQAVLNALEKIYKNLQDIRLYGDELLSQKDVWTITRAPFWLSGITHDTNGLRGLAATATAHGSLFSSPLIRKEDQDVLSGLCVQIVEKLVREYVERSGNDDYVMILPFTPFSNGSRSAGPESAQLPAIQAALGGLPPLEDGECAC